MIDSFKGKHRFLSNFYLSPMTIHRITYPTVEHYYQAMKTKDPELKKEIAQASSPGIAKRMGRRVGLKNDWENLKIIVMTQALCLKFTTYPELRKKLLETFPQILVEGNTWGDKYWGKCNGEGQNMLGLILMLIRNTLKEIV